MRVAVLLGLTGLGLFIPPSTVVLLVGTAAVLAAPSITGPRLRQGHGRGAAVAAVSG
jgi:hypothetical protein